LLETQPCLPSATPFSSCAGAPGRYYAHQQEQPQHGQQRARQARRPQAQRLQHRLRGRRLQPRGRARRRAGRRRIQRGRVRGRVGAQQAVLRARAGGRVSVENTGA